MATNSIDYINIDSDGNYFDTREQIKKSKIQWFVEKTTPSKISGSTSATGFFSLGRIVKDDSVYNSNSYFTSSTSIDSSGNSRPILDGRNDYYSSASLDIYKNGVEITQENHWIAGLAKITAGTPGHLYQPTLFGITDLSIIDSDRYIEIELFDPVKFVESGGNWENFTYPILTADSNEEENKILNGTIEPFPIRPVISRFSINFPFEPHATRGSLQSGNENIRFSTDRIVSIDSFDPSKKNAAWYLDAFINVVIEEPNFTGSLGQTGYFNFDENSLSPFVDETFTSTRESDPQLGSDLSRIIAMMSSSLGGTTYINSKQKSSTCGFVYDGAYQGTDSISYGGLLY